jgi:hypothetical protein
VRIKKGTRGTSKKTSNGISTNSLRMPRFPLALLVAWARPATLRSFVAVSEFLRFLPRVGLAEVDGHIAVNVHGLVLGGVKKRGEVQVPHDRSVEECGGVVDGGNPLCTSIVHSHVDNPQ